MLETLDDTLTRIAAEYYERLAPAIDRVWQDEIASMRTDLRVWVDQLATNAGMGAVVVRVCASVCPGSPDTIPSSLRDPVTIDGRFILRGSVDLVERKPGTKILRVTDHKTRKNRSARGSIIGGGAQLQPVIYSLAVEEATGCTVESGRFSYCTTAGGFTDHAVPINERDAADGHRSARDHRSRRRARHAAAGAGREGVRLVRLSAGLRPRSGAAAQPQIAQADRRLLELRGRP